MEKHSISTLEEFAELFCRNRENYIRMALRYVHVRDTAEELVHEGLVQFLEKRNELPNGSNVEAYYCTLLRHDCLDWLRAREVRLRKEKEIHEESIRLLQHEIAALESYDPNRIFNNEIYEIMNRELARLPELTRYIFLESRFSDSSYEEIADKYAVSKWKVAREVQAALTILTYSLRDYLPTILFFAAIQFFF